MCIQFGWQITLDIRQTYILYDSHVSLKVNHRLTKSRHGQIQEKQNGGRAEMIRSRR